MDAQSMVGIMVCRTEQTDPPFSDRSFYRKLVLAGARHGLNVFVFFPDQINWNNRAVNGYTYSSVSRKWIPALFSVPFIVYDRCFYTNKSTYLQYRVPIRRLKADKSIMFLNQRLKGKWDVFTMLSREQDLQPFLPDTNIYAGHLCILPWLDKEEGFILKPQHGMQGKGILHIRRNPHAQSEFLIRGRSPHNDPIELSFKRLSELMRWIHLFIGRRSYLIQQYLHLQTDEGRTYDVRILVQKNNIGLWQLTGMAARIGKLGSITSNLHGGGSAYELLPVLKKQFEDKQAGEIMKSLSQLAMRIPLILEQYHGRLAELGIDIGIDPFGKLWIIEVNSKPGHSSFSHFSDPSVSRSSISNPIHYAGYLLNKFKKNEVSLLPQAHRRVT